MSCDFILPWAAIVICVQGARKLGDYFGYRWCSRKVTILPPATTQTDMRTRLAVLLDSKSSSTSFPKPLSDLCAQYYSTGPTQPLRAMIEEYWKGRSEHDFSFEIFYQYFRLPSSFLTYLKLYNGSPFPIDLQNLYFNYELLEQLVIACPETTHLNLSKGKSRSLPSYSGNYYISWHPVVGFKKLEELDLSFWPQSLFSVDPDNDPTPLRPLSQLPRLKTLKFCGNDLSNLTLFVSLQDCQSLTTLDLSESKNLPLPQAGVIAGIRTLKTLVIKNCPFPTAEFLNELQRLRPDIAVQS